LSIDRTESAGGLGMSFNSDELLLPAGGGCFCNDMFREAPSACNFDLKRSRRVAMRLERVDRFGHRIWPCWFGSSPEPRPG